MTEMNIDKVLEELKRYNLKPWDLREAFQNSIKKGVEKEYGLYPNDRELIESDTIENSIKETVEAIKNKYDTIENAILHHEWENFKNYIRLEPDERTEKHTGFHVWEHSLREFIYMLRYSINGKFDDDYHETQIFMDLNGIKYDTNQGTFAIEGISFRIFKNHNVIVKGLTDEQYNRIVRGYENYKKYK